MHESVLTGFFEKAKSFQPQQYQDADDALKSSHVMLQDLLKESAEISEWRSDLENDLIGKITNIRVELEGMRFVEESPVGVLLNGLEGQIKKYREEVVAHSEEIQKFFSRLDDPYAMLNEPPPGLDEKFVERWNEMQQKMSHAIDVAKMEAIRMLGDKASEKEIKEYVTEHAYGRFGLRGNLAEFKELIMGKHINIHLSEVDLDHLRSEYNDKRLLMRNIFNAMERGLKIEGSDLSEKIENFRTHLQVLDKEIDNLKAFLPKVGRAIKNVLLAQVKLDKKVEARLSHGIEELEGYMAAKPDGVAIKYRK